jgi:hypothetical protein
MRCPLRHEPVMDAIIPVPVAPVVQPRAYVAEKSPLTNRIRRHFARIKAVGSDCGGSWLPRPIGNSAVSGGTGGPEGLEHESRRVGDTKTTQEASKPKAFEAESQDISKPKVRTFRGRKRGRSCRPPFHFQLRRGRASDVRSRPRPPARRCDRPSGRSAPRD